MTSKKLFALAIAIFAIFAFTGTAMAVNRVEVKVTSEPIRYQALCDKAGGFSLEFDSETIIQEGDRITIDVDFKNPTTFASICKKIDLEISLGSGAPFLEDELDPAGANPTAMPLQYREDEADRDNDLTVVGGIIFRIKAEVGAQRITIDVVGTTAGVDYIMVGNEDTDTLILQFLDQKINGVDFTAPTTDGGIWVDEDGDGVYDDAATRGDNTLCINVSQWDEAVVDGNMDSEDDKFTFIPSDPQIAHIAPQVDYSFDQCDKIGGPGRVQCGSRGDQAVDTCASFDYDGAFGGSPYGYVSGTHYSDLRVIIKTTDFYDETEYQIQMEILVNGLTGDNGVFFNREVVRTQGFENKTDVCNSGAPSMVTSVGAIADYMYWLGNGSGTAYDNVEPIKGFAIDSCDVADTARATKLLTPTSGLSLTKSDKYLLIDIPAMHYDLDDINVGDVVTLRITLIKAPCGTIFEGDITIGTMCPEPPEPPTAPVYTLLYPYFTAMDNDNWWDGFVVTNLSSSTCTFTAIVYEQDGDVGAFTGSIDPASLFQSTLAQQLAGATLLSVGSGAGAGNLGDSLCYIIVCADQMVDGFGFMGSLSANVLMANESMGYLPRYHLSLCSGVTPGEAMSP